MCDGCPECNKRSDGYYCDMKNVKVINSRGLSTDNFRSCMNRKDGDNDANPTNKKTMV